MLNNENPVGATDDKSTNVQSQVTSSPNNGNTHVSGSQSDVSTETYRKKSEHYLPVTFDNAKNINIVKDEHFEGYTIITWERNGVEWGYSTPTASLFGAWVKQCGGLDSFKMRDTGSQNLS